MAAVSEATPAADDAASRLSGPSQASDGTAAPTLTSPATPSPAAAEAPAPQRVLCLSSQVKSLSVVTEAVRQGVIVLLYAFDGSSLNDLFARVCAA